MMSRPLHTLTARKRQVLAVFLALALASLACGLPPLQSSTAVRPKQATVTPLSPLQAETPLPPATPTRTLTQPPALTVSPTLAPTLTFTPTQPPTYTFTPTQMAVLNPDAWDDVPPEDVIEEIGLLQISAAGPCRIVHRHEGVFTLDGERELMEEADFYSDEWPVDEVLNVTVYDPNQTQVASFQVTAGRVFGAHVPYRALLNQPPGPYRFVLEGPSGRLEVTQVYRLPTGPRIYRLSAAEYQVISGLPAQGDGLYLWGFAPGERVQVLAYSYRTPGSYGYSFLGARRYPVDSQGRLFIVLQGPQEEVSRYVFVALGEQSGEVRQRHLNFCGLLVDIFQSSPLFCQGALPVRVRILKPVQMAPELGEIPLLLHEKADVGSAVSGELHQGEQASILYGPKCTGGVLWWYIQAQDTSTSGWVAESAGGSYLIEPVGE